MRVKLFRGDEEIEVYHTDIARFVAAGWSDEPQAEPVDDEPEEIE